MTAQIIPFMHPSELAELTEQEREELNEALSNQEQKGFFYNPKYHF